MQQIPPEWLQQLDELLALTAQEPGAEQEDAVLDQLVAADPDLLAFLVTQFAEQDAPQAAALIEMLAAHADVSEAVRAQSRAALATMAERGVQAPAPCKERFYAGWVQQGRERGEQILMLGWRMPSGDIEAMVFLLDWRGDGLKDYYRTRRMRDAEWRQLIEHNATKGAELTEVTLADARSLLDAAIGESKRFSRPLPREFKVDSQLVERRILHVEAPAQPRSYVSSLLTPDEVVVAYVAALHHRDYLLAAELLAAEHPLRQGRTVEEAAAELRIQLKHAPRREVTVRTTRETGRPEATDEADEVEVDEVEVDEVEVDEVEVEATGEQTTIEHSGRRLKQAIVERYTLRRAHGNWRINAVATPDEAAG
jgi:hypothetical protein